MRGENKNKKSKNRIYKNNKIQCIIIVASSVIILLCICIIGFSVNRSTAYAFESSMNDLIKDIDYVIDNKEEMSYSSNPYDYIKGNENYEDIVDMGVRVLPELISSLDESDKSGLEEYIYAVAIEDITDIDLKINNQQWKDGQEFKREYKAYVRNAEDQINYIIDNEKFIEAEKVTELEEFGVYALPYIEESKSHGNNQFDQADTNIKDDFCKNTSQEKVSSTETEIIKETMKNIIEEK
jgi:hypothetical protein